MRTTITAVAIRSRDNVRLAPEGPRTGGSSAAGCATFTIHSRGSGA
jgi:hypothetical protein